MPLYFAIYQGDCRYLRAFINFLSVLSLCLQKFHFSFFPVIFNDK